MFHKDTSGLQVNFSYTESGEHDGDKTLLPKQCILECPAMNPTFMKSFSVVCSGIYVWG